MSATSLQDLYHQKLQMMLDAELFALQSMPELVAKAQTEELRVRLEQHAQQTKEHVRRLEQLFDSHGRQPDPLESRSLRAVVEEARTILPGIEDADTRDAYIIASAQAIEHHEIAAYGTARTWAAELGLTDDAQILQRTLEEEKQADRMLTMVAEAIVNAEAAESEREVEVSSGGRADRAEGDQSDQRAERSAEPGSAEADLR